MRSGLANLGVLISAAALMTGGLALLVPTEAEAGSAMSAITLAQSAGSGMAVVPGGAAAAIAAAQATTVPVPPVPGTDAAGAIAAQPAAPASAVVPAPVAQALSGAVAAAQATPAVAGGVDPAPMRTAPARPDRGFQAQSAPVVSDPATRAQRPATVSDGSSSPPAKTIVTVPGSDAPQMAPPAPNLARLANSNPAPVGPAPLMPPGSAVSRMLTPASLGQLMPSGLDNLGVVPLSSPSENVGSLFPFVALLTNPGGTSGAPPPLSGDASGVPSLQDPGGLAGFLDPATQPRVAAAAALLSATGDAISSGFPGMPGGSGQRPGADLSASAGITRLVQLLLSATDGPSFGLPLVAAAQPSVAPPAALARAVRAEAAWAGAPASALTAQGMTLTSERAPSFASPRARRLRPASRPGSAPMPEGPPSLPPALAGGASVTPGVGIGSGTSAIALMAALVLCLSQFIPGRVSLELTGWPSALLTLRLERPG